MANWELERTWFQRGTGLVGGCDEVGRGPLAGPVVAAVTVFRDCSLEGMRDSKALTARAREELSREICHQAVAVGIGLVDNTIIDEINILQATRLAMYKAWQHLHTKPGYLLIDGVEQPDFGVEVNCDTVIGGDSRCASIAAASIVAKVFRDRLMSIYHRSYPKYGFDRHKGYPTRQHKLALEQNGPCPLHRVSFRGVLP